MDEDDSTREPELLILPVDRLTFGVDFRLDDDGDTLAELAASIIHLGVVLPLVVRETSTGWEVVAGRRRLTAARMAGLDCVPCVVRPMTDDEAVDIALAENVHRRRLSAVEQGLAYALLRKQGLTQMEIAQRVGVAQNTVSVNLRVLDLPEALRQKVHRGEMGALTALDRAGRRSHRGERSTGGTMDGETAALITHWRRRHERLLAGIHAVLKAKPQDTHHWLALIDRLFALDRQPLPDDTVAGSA